MAANSSRTGTKTGKRTAKSKPAKSTSSRVPGWLLLTAGVVIGVFVTMLTRLSPNVGVTPPGGQGSKGQQQAETKEDQGPVFDFYTLLPESEVMVPQSGSAKTADKPAPVKEKPKPKPESKPATQPSKPAVVERTPKPAAQGQYLLQAGSFRSSQDADRLRAQLIITGHEARVETVTVRGKETWHRVQLGPFSDEASAESVRQQLAGQGLETMLLKKR
ncbi:SPOR domain-containing protein [Parendozoicomonas haliclonae]|uniref:Cell division protein FtsN n=1 Tax=Parendozoicomonas haliclonae TaxID=1960125 RepID=A0A1X7ADK6_9GAMM|nr:SPOR domain-containing protein [Parendozoicomonas haliclonae]SMA32040.1 cell division protein FtsN [Parendozoicomonas haliclonae]